VQRDLEFISVQSVACGVGKEKDRVIPPPVLLIGCLLLSALMQHVRPWSIADYSFAAGMVIGSSALLLAAVLAAWGIWVMKRHGTAIEPGRIPTRLVTTGPFRFTRNPLYLALLLVFTGLAIMTNSMWLALGVGGLLLLLDRLVVAREEGVLTRAFGAEFSAYLARVRRWV
jgi:protein-S-isoprenylcysteine O-methyltransferase Ste14